MENEYIIEGNKLILGFEGYEHVSDDPETYHEGYYYKEGEGAEHIEDCLFHESWDWLIPIIDKIRNMPKVIAFEISFSLGVIVKTFYNGKWHFYESNDIIEAPYVAVIDYIKWYNNEQINNNR